MKKISNTDTKKLENLYKLNKIDELEQETKKLLAIDKNNAILLNILGLNTPLLLILVHQLTSL